MGIIARVTKGTILIFVIMVLDYTRLVLRLQDVDGLLVLSQKEAEVVYRKGGKEENVKIFFF
jgi:hypothetical protein